MKNIIKQHGYKIDFYNGDFQYKDNSMCGYFAIFICRLINKYKLSISKTKKLIYKYFGDDADDNDIKILIDHFPSPSTV
jgi:hypothetical protein